MHRLRGCPCVRPPFVIWLRDGNRHAASRDDCRNRKTWRLARVRPVAIASLPTQNGSVLDPMSFLSDPLLTKGLRGTSYLGSFRRATGFCSSE